MIFVDDIDFLEPVNNSGSSSSSDAPAHKPMVTQRIYPDKIDMSRIPYFFVSEDGDDDEASGFYEFPEYDFELVECCGRPAPRYCKGKLKRSHVYYVEVRADSCTAEECLQLLKAIDCEKQFISCSVESAQLFLAELHKDEVDKLKGLDGIHRVYLFAGYGDLPKSLLI